MGDANEGGLIADSGGPFVGLAVLCRDAIVSDRNLVTIVDIFDRVWPPSFPFWVNVVFAIGLHPGKWRGTRDFLVQVEDPDRIVCAEFKTTQVFEDGERTFWDHRFQLAVTKYGAYSFDVIVRDVVLTRIPLQVLQGPPEDAPECTGRRRK